MNNHQFYTEFPNYQDFKMFTTMFRILQIFSMCTYIWVIRRDQNKHCERHNKEIFFTIACKIKIAYSLQFSYNLTLHSVPRHRMQ